MRPSLPHILVLVLAAASAGCDKSDAKTPPPTGPGAPRGTTRGEHAPPLVDAVVRPGGERGQVEPRGEGGAVPTVARGGSASFAGELARVFAAWSAEEAALVEDAKTRLAQAIGQGTGAFAKSVKSLYDARDKRLVFSRAGELTEDADRLLEILYAIDTHGVPTAPYALEELRAQVTAFSDASLAGQELVARGMSADEKTLWEFLLANRGTAERDLAARADDAGLGDADLGRLSEARKRVNALLSARKQLNAALVELDVALVRRLHRWVYDMRFARRAHPFTADKSDDAGITRAEKEVVKLLSQVALDDGGAIDRLARLVTPAFPDYEPTRQALARYRALAAAHPQHLELPKEVDKLASDMKGMTKAADTITLLERRLAEEGYLAGEPTGKFGPELEAAVKAYQETHQLKVTGKLEKVMRGSLNRTYAERAKTLELSLQRYRESDLHQGAFRFGEVPTRARVNIPGFEARFYLGTELGRTHRVVVGNNDTDVDGELQKKGKLNQTRLFTAEMQTVILNPVWRVPRRIKEQELDQLLMDEPDYYEKHNFKVETLPDGTELVVQQPGPRNALGLVKFLFPNQFSIYMHDTPSKKLFERPVRAFSHGCMRTQDPLDLARWILVEVTGKLTDAKFDEVLASGKESAFALDKRIPISTDYVTTGIDAQGRVVFYADVYGFDRDYFEGKTPYATDSKLPLTVIF